MVIAGANSEKIARFEQVSVAGGAPTDFDPGFYVEQVGADRTPDGLGGTHLDATRWVLALDGSSKDPIYFDVEAVASRMSQQTTGPSSSRRGA